MEYGRNAALPGDADARRNAAARRGRLMATAANAAAVVRVTHRLKVGVAPPELFRIEITAPRRERRPVCPDCGYETPIVRDGRCAQCAPDRLTPAGERRRRLAAAARDERPL